jgi:hypothetical protein
MSQDHGRPAPRRCQPAGKRPDDKEVMVHMMIFMVFLVGSLLGVLMGGALCVRYLRQEVAAGIGPKLGHMQYQLDTIESEVRLADATRHAELTAGCRHQHDG